ENTPAFTDNNIFCLTVSRDNTLWIGSEGGGLIRYREGEFHSFSAADGLSNSFVRTIFEDHTGRIWVGTDNGLLRVNGDRLDRIDDTAEFPVIAVHAIYEDSIGGLWVGGSKLLRLADEQVSEVHLDGKGSENRLNTLYMSASQT